MIPPPNVTGALHLGHALNNTIQDILIRWRRMQGYDALWMPGTDHAGSPPRPSSRPASARKRTRPRHDIGRDELVRRIWAWKDEYEARILSQLRLMGCSCDWDRTRFTLDEMCARAVRTTFFDLFKADKIYRGKRLVNWDVQLRTAVADDEIEYVEQAGQIWTIPLPGGRLGRVAPGGHHPPETMLGDTAVAVHPSDERYKHLIGKAVTLPLTGRSIPIIADAILVDPAFGTGCVKVTPAHDPNDYATGVRHGLAMINLMNPDGTYNEEAGPYAGLDRYVVRRAVVADLDAQGLLVKVEHHANRVGLSDRSKTPIEPYLSDQWFVRMDELAQHAMDAVTTGPGGHPPRPLCQELPRLAGREARLVHQPATLVGAPDPVWSRDLAADASDEEWDAVFHWSDADEMFDPTTGSTRRGWSTSPRARPSRSGPGTGSRPSTPSGPRPPAAALQAPPTAGIPSHEAYLEKIGFVQDPDVLDTWFSSALWPHRPSAGPNRRPSWRSITRPTSCRRPATSSRCGSPGW